MDIFSFSKMSQLSKSLEKNHHRNCFYNGELLVEPYKKLVKCESCSEIWNILNSKFSFYCAYEFYPSEVEDALSTTQLLINRLLQKLNEMDTYEKRIISKFQNSFQQWIHGISYEIARLLGTTVSKTQELINNFFEKWSF